MSRDSPAGEWTSLAVRGIVVVVNVSLPCVQNTVKATTTAYRWVERESVDYWASH